MRYEITQWRKRLEKRGWHNAKRFAAPHSEWIEYHAAWKGKVWSGRCKLSDCDHADWFEPGTHVYLIQRMHEVDEAVWRRTDGRVEGLMARRLVVR